MAVFHFFFWPRSIPLYICATSSLGETFNDIVTLYLHFLHFYKATGNTKSRISILGNPLVKLI